MLCTYFHCGEEKKKREMSREKMEIFFRGGANLYYFQVGAWIALARFLNLDTTTRLKGISSGALIATLIACNLPLLKTLFYFERLVHVWKGMCCSSSSSLWISFLKWHLFDCFYRYSMVKYLLPRLINDEMACQCSGRLTIVVFSLSDMRVIERNQWNSASQLCEWILASMATPFTSLPRCVEGRWLMDAYNLDLMWSSRKDRCVEVSAVEGHAQIFPRVKIPLWHMCIHLTRRRLCYHFFQGFWAARMWIYDIKIWGKLSGGTCSDISKD